MTLSKKKKKVAYLDYASVSFQPLEDTQEEEEEEDLFIFYLERDASNKCATHSGTWSTGTQMARAQRCGRATSPPTACPPPLQRSRAATWRRSGGVTFGFLGVQ